MPVALIHALAAMLPRLEAEEALAALRLGGAAQRMVPDGDGARELARELERAAQREGRTRRRAAKATPEQLAAMGIATVTSEG